jgi:5-methylcytosine-specific restriction endonuclease McrA
MKSLTTRKNKKMSRSVEHRFSKTLKKKILRAAGDLCSICAISLNMATAEPHHIIPVSFGGATTRENCQILCRPCHIRLHQKRRR